MRNDINIRASRFIVAQTLGVCGHCRKATRLVALAVPPGHMALELDDEAQDEETAVDTWRIAANHALLFHVEYLPAAVRRRLRQFASSYRLSDPAAHWANHCGHCGASFDDQELFCEPGGAFLPPDESSAGSIHLERIDEAFEAVAAGYAYEPCFFGSLV
jgi:hypothetical protein